MSKSIKIKNPVARRAPEIMMRSINDVWCIYARKKDPTERWRFLFNVFCAHKIHCAGRIGPHACVRQKLKKKGKYLIKF